MKNGIADRSGKGRPVGQCPPKRRRSRDLETQQPTACLLLARLSQKKERQPGIARPQMQTAALGQPEFDRIAPHFQNDSSKSVNGKGSFRHPQRLFELARRGINEVLRQHPEA